MAREARSRSSRNFIQKSADIIAMNTVWMNAAQEERLAEAVANGDGSVSALVAALKARQQEREDLEARLAELETWERDVKADEERVE